MQAIFRKCESPGTSYFTLLILTLATFFLKSVTYFKSIHISFNL